MTLPSGTRLGPYEILALLGAGGMGEVYRAQDTRLGREVAIKVLSDSLARDPEALGRFEREARVLASIEHPHIAVIHGLEEISGTRFLVLELVEGETLAEKLATGPFPVAEALRIGVEISSALEAAHEKGVVHRDLKPANVKLARSGRVKVLDFGLAKSVIADEPGLSAVETLSASGITRDGTILGTPAYMSPEQVRGKTLDRRSDLWSLGCVLYEMLAGRPAFAGETVSDTLVAVLSKEPDWTALPKSLPDAIHQLLRRCLEKDSTRRLRDAGDAQLELERQLSVPPTPAGGFPTETSRKPGRLATLWKSVLARPRGKAPATAAPTSPKLSQVTFADALEGFPSFSADGGRLAFSRDVGSVRKLVVKDLKTGAERLVTSGTADDLQPSWRLNGSELLFTRAQLAGRRLEPADVFGRYEGCDIWSIDIESGREQRLIENAANPSVSPDGTRIAFDASWAGPRRLWLADERGRNPRQASSDASEAVGHLRPRWSPDGRCLVFQNMERTRFDVRVLDLATQALIWVTNDHLQDICPTWGPSDRFIYFSSYRSGGMNLWRIPVGEDGSPSGLLQQLTTGAGQDVEAAISPDGRRLAFSILKQNAVLWRLPVSPGSGRAVGEPEKLIAATRENSRGAWSPDGRSIAFNSDRSGDMNIWISQSEDGSARALTSGPGGDFQPRFSPDGERIVFFSSREGSADIWTAEVRTGRLRRLTSGPAIDVNPVFSPDGRHIAYASDQGGRLEVWVMGADGRQARPLTQVGVAGHFLLWTPESDALLFRCPAPSSRTMRVALSGSDPEPTAEVVGGAHMSFSPDGARILDVLGHKALWVSPLVSGSPEKVFEFTDPDVRIDYPFWSPDGRSVLFDRFRPQGGDVWMMEGIE